MFTELAAALETLFFFACNISCLAEISGQRINFYSFSIITGKGEGTRITGF